MKRLVAIAVLLAALAGWIAAGALTADPPPASAQTPMVELNRTQKANFIPRATGKRPIFILAIGSDARPGVCMPVERCLADSLHLVAVNPRLKGATILGFPRDSYVPIPGVGTGRINDALHFGGPELVVETVEQMTGIRIDYYLLTSFQGLRQMVNALGGIDVNVPYPMNDAASGAFFDAGPQTLDGDQALALARNRKDTPDGDFSRSQNQGLLLLAALAKLRGEFAQDPSSLFAWIGVGVRNVQTDLSLEEILHLFLSAVQVDPANVANTVIPGSLGFAGEASVVFPAPQADEVYADIADDGLLTP